MSFGIVVPHFKHLLFPLITVPSGALSPEFISNLISLFSMVGYKKNFLFSFLTNHHCPTKGFLKLHAGHSTIQE